MVIKYDTYFYDSYYWERDKNGLTAAGRANLSRLGFIEDSNGEWVSRKDNKKLLYTTAKDGFPILSS